MKAAINSEARQMLMELEAVVAEKVPSIWSITRVLC